MLGSIRELLHYVERLLHRFNVAYRHSALAFLLVEFASAEIGGGVVDDASESFASVERAVGVAHEIKHHASAFQRDALRSSASSEAAKRGDE